MSNERPILFRDPMVRAILAGRKKQVRLIIDQVRGFGRITSFGESDTPGYAFRFRCKRRLWQEFRRQELLDRCPCGTIGDRLWVRETWAVVPHVSDDGPKHKAKGDGTGATWRADWNGNPSGFKWKPSIYMPRWASRITLEVTGVRVERLNEISNEDIVAEGIEAIGKGVQMPDGSYAQAGRYESKASTTRQLFSSLWASTNGPGAWELNPWVWVVEFAQAKA